VAKLSVAVAAFARTPGYTPAKTRLASGVGAENAAEFYRLSLAITEALLGLVAQQGMSPYWAVTEAHGLDDPRWQSLPRLWQGEGGLGERQDRVYRHLLKEHSGVLLIGADCPLLTPGDLIQASQLAVGGEPFVLGPATDGGYYLFGGRLAVPSPVWTGVEYSTPGTAGQLRAALRPFGAVELLPELPDVDTAADLIQIPRHPRARGELLPGQRALIGWIERLGPEGRGVDVSRKVDILEP
jgi:glycosyltransferase A (GT-A) superfamily protein (DUF2064 family)